MKRLISDMNWMRDWPIRQKLTLVIMLTCGTVLLLACGLLGAYQVYEFRDALVRNTTVLTDVLAQNTQAVLAFQDERSLAPFWPTASPNWAKRPSRGRTASRW